MPNINDWPALGQFVGVSHRHDRTIGRSKIIVAVYGAENAMGLIGSEYNGIVVIDDTQRQVLLDRHADHPGGSGYHGPCAATVAEFERLKGLADDEFLVFVRTHPRARDKDYRPRDNRGDRQERKERSKRSKVFKDEQFQSIEKSATAQQKARWANHLVTFVESGFARKNFTKAFYEQLTNCFYHIAHFNQGGFWSEWFDTLPDQLRWLEHVAKHTANGDPKYCWVDVERAVAAWVRDQGLVRLYAERVAALRKEAEVEQLRRLADKHPDELARLAKR